MALGFSYQDALKMPPRERRIAIATTTAMRAYLAPAVGWDFTKNQPIFPDYNKLTRKRRR